MIAKTKVSNGKRKAPAKKSSTMKLYDSIEQKNASASAKRHSLKVSGKTTSVYGHVMAAGQRKQARRDAKN